MLVMQSIFGNWDRALGSASLLSSRLSDIIAKHNLANSYMSFSTSYSDTGLWGIYLVSENLGNLDDLLHFTLREWTRMSIAPTTAEVERAKSQLKASLLLGLDGTTAIAEDIGRQLVTSGHRMTPKQIENAIDAVTPEEVKRVAQKYLWDKDVRHLLDFSPRPVGADLNDRLPSRPSVRLRACSTITVSVQTCHPCSIKPTVAASPIRSCSVYP
jgi:mitochondrial-processing peptidase subunit beta